MPERIQLRRTKGWRKPEGVIVVSRPSLWGNPLRVAELDGSDPYWLATNFYREWLAGRLDHPHLERQREWILDQLPKLAGHDLACWCPPDQPCHADVLLELANGPR
jgi:hypothetical protein